MMYVLKKDNQYLYKTSKGEYIFSNVTNMFFATEEHATNWLHFNAYRFDSKDVIIERYKRSDIDEQVVRRIVS